MHNVLQQQQLIEIFKTVGADELHNIQIYNKRKPMNEIDRVGKTRNCRASNPDKTGNLHPDPNQISKEAKPGERKLGPETKL